MTAHAKGYGGPPKLHAKADGVRVNTSRACGRGEEISMNKQDLIAKIAKDTGSSKAGAAAAVDSLIDGITKSLKKGDSITFVGFGTFKTALRKARTARNPQTGAAIKIPKRRVVRFSAGKALKEHVR
jgi:DNA-binding protein HU-beta